MIELVRLAVVPDGAFGILLYDRLPWLATCERTYSFAGVQQLVKIPCGTYRCLPTVYQKGSYDTFEITGVVGHSRLLFHVGNSEEDSEGCILLGRYFHELDGRWAVLDSKPAFADFMWRLRQEPFFDLKIRHDQGVDARWK